jgi:chromosome partitioning protein
MRVLSLVNQKGGCGKTTVAIHLAGALAAGGARVLVVDLDPQAHATLGLGCDGSAGLTVNDVLLQRVSARRAARGAPGGLRLLAGSPGLVEFERACERAAQPETALRTALGELAGEFDFALLDCPARADGVLTENALCASTFAILVVETGAFALQGALRAHAILREVAAGKGARFDLRVLATMFDRRTRFARELLLALHARFAREMFDTAIRTSVRLREAAAVGVPLTVLDPRSRAASDFSALAREVLALEPLHGRDLRPRAPLLVPAVGSPAQAPAGAARAD